MLHFWSFISTPPVKALKQKANDDIAKAIDSKDVEQEAQQARAELLESKAMLSKSCYSILQATDLILGDIVEVGEGCKVPADMRMIEMLSYQLRVDQAFLLGESCSVEKELDATNITNAVYQDKTNILFLDLLVDVRDKLLFETEYAGNFKDKQPPKSSLRIPWAWLPGALCLLQEVS
ncbi:hypothetical protein OROHE_013622 [Orobanche hederae]